MDDPDGYLIEGLEKRWRLPSADIVTTVKAVPEDEIQEVIVEMRDENAKPSGTTANVDKFERNLLVLNISLIFATFLLESIFSKLQF